MASAGHNRSALGLFAHLDDERLNPGTPLEPLIRDLLARRHHGFGVAEIEHHCAEVRLLDDSGDEISLAALIDFEDLSPLGIAQPLHDHLLGSLCSNTAEVVRSVFPLPHHVAVLVKFLAVDDHLAGVGVDCHASFFGGTGTALVSRHHRIGESVEDRLLRHTLLSFEKIELLHKIRVHRLPRLAPGLGDFSHRKTVRA